MKRNNSKHESNRNDNLTTQQRHFAQEISDLTEQGVIQWHRVGDEMHATISLELAVDFLDCPDPVRSLVVVGSDVLKNEMYLPLPEDVLLDECLDIEEFAEQAAKGTTEAEVAAAD